MQLITKLKKDIKEMEHEIQILRLRIEYDQQVVKRKEEYLQALSGELARISPSPKGPAYTNH